MDKTVKQRVKKIAIILLVAGGGLLAWKLLRPKPNDAFVSGNGRIEATEVDVAAKLGGRIDHIWVDEGDFVHVGQPLAQMELASLKAQDAEAQAQYQQAIQSVAADAAQVAARQSDKATDLAVVAQRHSDMAAAEAVVSQRESDLASAKADVTEREADLDAAQRRLARSSTLSKEGASSVQELDDDRARATAYDAKVTATKAKVATAESAVSAARSQLEAARAALNAAQAHVATADANIKAAATDVEGAKRTVDAKKASIQRVEVDIKDSTLVAPRDGRVQFRIAQPGEVVPPGGRLLNLVDLGDVYMTFFVPEKAAGRIAIGSEARIVLDAVPQYVIPAYVSFVASVAQFTPKTVETATERQKLMFRVKAQIDRELLRQHLTMVKTGLPGIAWVKLDPKANWPKNLTPNVLPPENARVR
jgi:HlyD family secretion protein